MNEQRTERWDRVALVAVIMLIMVLLIGWIQYNFGISTAAMTLGGLFVAVICAATARFTANQIHRSQQNAADLLHEFGSAQAGSYKVIEQQLRADRDKLRIEGKAMQLEAKQTGGDEWMVEQTADSGYGPVYVD